MSRWGYILIVAKGHGGATGACPTSCGESTAVHEHCVNYPLACIPFGSFSQGKYTEAQPLLERGLAIFEATLGVDHPSTIKSRACVGDFYARQGLLGKASPLMGEVISALERVHGGDHPDVAAALNNRAQLLKAQVRAIRIFLESWNLLGPLLSVNRTSSYLVDCSLTTPPCLVCRASTRRQSLCFCGRRRYRRRLLVLIIQLWQSCSTAGR